MLNEFKTFISRGNVMDMAVGIIMGTAFTAIVRSLVDDVIMPFVGVFTGGVDFTNLYINLSGGEYDTLAAAQEAGAATINYGLFLNAILTFLIVAFAVFVMVKQVNRMKKKQEEEPQAAPAPPADVALLTEIRDLLKSERT